MSVALIGSVSSSWHALHALIKAEVQVCGVCGLDQRHATGVSDYRSLRDLAEQAKIDFLTFDKVTDPDVYQFLKRHQPDLLFVIGLSQLVPAHLRHLARLGAVGFHPTMLPRMRGRAPVAWTILLAQQPAVSLFFLTDHADAGDLIIQRPVPLMPHDYAADLIDRTNQVLETCIAELAPAIKAHQLPRTPQDDSQATWLAKRTRSDGLIDFTQPAERIYRLVRAASHPYPGAFTHHDSRELIVWRAQPHHRRDHVAAAGQIVDVRADRGLLVQTGDGLLWLTDLQYALTDARPDLRQFRPGRHLGLNLPCQQRPLADRLDHQSRPNDAEAHT